MGTIKQLQEFSNLQLLSISMKAYIKDLELYRLTTCHINFAIVLCSSSPFSPLEALKKHDWDRCQMTSINSCPKQNALLNVKCQSMLAYSWDALPSKRKAESWLFQQQRTSQHFSTWGCRGSQNHAKQASYKPF